jgi:hypothetical protein
MNPDAMSAYATMHDDRLFNDVEIESASDGELIPAHKVVLATASSTLKKMLTSEMVEARTNKITIKASFNTTKAFVRYMYIYTISLSDLGHTSDFTLAELYHLSQFYNVECLARDCLTKMETTLNLSNMIGFLFIAEKYKVESLKKRCLDLIMENAILLMCTDNWIIFLSVNPWITKLLREVQQCNTIVTSRIHPKNFNKVSYCAQVVNFLRFDEDGLLKSYPIADLAPPVVYEGTQADI